LEEGYSATPNPKSAGVSLPAFYLNGNTNVSAGTVNSSGTVYTNDPTNTYFGSSSYMSTVIAPGAALMRPGYGTYYSSNAKTAGAPDYIPSTMGYLDPKNGGRSPEFTGWSFGFERTMTKDLTLSVSYVGNEGHHLLATGTERGYYGNQMDPKWLGLQGALQLSPLTAANLTNNGLSLPYTSFNNTSISSMLVAFPQYSGVTDLVDAVSNSNYNSLQLTVNQRMSHGLTVMFNYTFSKSIDNAGTFRAGYAIPAFASADGKNYAQGKADRSLSTFDQRQSINSTATYDLPFGKGHIGGGNVITRNIGSGWRLSGIVTYIGGNPLSLTSATCSDSPGQGTCMPAFNPNYTAKSARQNGGWGHGATRLNLATTQYINPDAFVQTGSFTGTGKDSNGVALPNLNAGYVIGDTPRTGAMGLRGPGNYNIDSSLRRTFDVWNKENVKFVLEANVFNAVNHVWFGSTGTNNAGNAASIGQSVGSSSLGVVTGQANNPRQFQFA